GPATSAPRACTNRNHHHAGAAMIIPPLAMAILPLFALAPAPSAETPVSTQPRTAAQARGEVPGLIETYYTSTETARRTELLQQLARARDPRAAVTLGEALGDSDPAIAAAAARGLADHFLEGGDALPPSQHARAALECWNQHARQWHI